MISNPNLLSPGVYVFHMMGKSYLGAIGVYDNPALSRYSRWYLLFGQTHDQDDWGSIEGVIFIGSSLKDLQNYFKPNEFNRENIDEPNSRERMFKKLDLERYKRDLDLCRKIQIGCAHSDVIDATYGHEKVLIGMINELSKEKS